MTEHRYLVLSDAHFGTQESSINIPLYASALVRHIAELAPWTEIILTGDLLDVNLSTFTRSIEGGTYPDIPIPLLGFRQFLDGLHAALRARAPSMGLADAAERWVYVPGNHDYKVWDILATKVVFTDVLRDGRRMGSIPAPLRRHTWRGLDSFFAGIFKPYNAHDRVIVSYPDHAAVISGDTAIFTHGHYLDAAQTWRNDLHSKMAREQTAEGRAKRIRSIMIETAQYQAAANAVSFTKNTRRLFNGLFGPEGLLSSLDKLVMVAAALILRLIFLGERHRGRNISKRLLLNIESYLTYFCELPKPPKWFVFGHTHRQDRARTPNLGIDVYNVGSCYRDRGMPITFLEIVAARNGAPSFRLMSVDERGRVGQVAA